ncbi:MAG: hypothetical protein AB1295_03850 [Candidatus Micrarchaeota archaeon]
MSQRRYYRQIVIRYVTVPKAEEDPDSELDYIYQCLGLGDERDEVGRAVFRALVRANLKGEGISSRDIMELSEVSQAAVIYHLNTFMRSGLVVKDGRNYFLRGRTLEETLEDMENDMHRRFQHLKDIAKKVEDKEK